MNTRTDTRMRGSILFLAMVVATVSATAQFNLPEFLPGDCRQAAISSAKQKAPDAELIAVLTAKIAVPFGGNNIDVSFNLENGRSEAWIYVFRSVSGDSSIFLPVIRIPIIQTCTPLDLGLPSLPIGELGTSPVVQSPLQGTAVINALKTVPKYNAYRAAYPDSLPNVVSLGSAVADLPAFPAGTPYWFFLFVGQAGSQNMTCFVHAESGLADCIGPDINSVADAAAARGVAVAPNPTHDVAYVSLPTEWTGRRVDVVLVDVLGATHHTFSTQPDVPGLILPVHDLPTGHYTMRLICDGDVISIPLVH